MIHLIQKIFAKPVAKRQLLLFLSIYFHELGFRLPFEGVIRKQKQKLHELDCLSQECCAQICSHNLEQMSFQINFYRSIISAQDIRNYFCNQILKMFCALFMELFRRTFCYVLALCFIWFAIVKLNYPRPIEDCDLKNEHFKTMF